MGEHSANCFACLLVHDASILKVWTAVKYERSIVCLVSRTGIFPRYICEPYTRSCNRP